MKRFLKVMGILSIAMVLVAGLSYGQAKKAGMQKVAPSAYNQPQPGKEDPPVPGKTWDKATPNLSFPVIMTDVVQMFFQQYPVYDLEKEKYRWYVSYDSETGLPMPILVDESIDDSYDGNFLGNSVETYDYYTLLDGCATDISGPLGVPDGIIDDYDLNKTVMFSFLDLAKPWYDQPVYMSGEIVTKSYTLPDGTLVSYEGPAYGDPNLIWDAGYIENTIMVGTDAYPSLATGGANAWQADWKYMGPLGTITVDAYDVTTGTVPVVEEGVVKIDFIDWGNPLENIYPVVGQRFPVEVALYEKVSEWTTADDLDDNSMTIFRMACLDYPGTLVELFGNGAYNYDGTVTGATNTFEGAFATVLTNQFSAEVWDPAGGIVKIPIEPGIGPSGKMNFASAGGGWTPTMPGWHRIWLHVTDPLISLTWAKVNNDEHYIMSSGCKVQDLNKNKQSLVGVIGDSTYIDVLVKLPSGGKIK
jgi:hypothetical protein